MRKPRPWLICITVAALVLIYIGCKRVAPLVRQIDQPVVVNPNPRKTVTMAARDMLLAAAIATNISAVHTTITLINLDYGVGYPVFYTNKLGSIYKYVGALWFWECSTNLKTWTWDGWSTNKSETMAITNGMKFYRGWNVPHGYSLKWFTGTPQPPEL